MLFKNQHARNKEGETLVNDEATPWRPQSMRYIASECKYWSVQTFSIVAIINEHERSRAVSSNLRSAIAGNDPFWGGRGGRRDALRRKAPCNRR